MSVSRAWKDCLQCGVYVCEWALKGGYSAVSMSVSGRGRGGYSAVSMSVSWHGRMVTVRCLCL